MTFSVHEAKTQFSRILDLVESGEEVIIIRHGKPVAQLVPPKVEGRKSVFGAMRGQITLPEGWEAPMTDEEVDAFLDGKY